MFFKIGDAVCSISMLRGMSGSEQEEGVRRDGRVILEGTF